MISCSKTNLGHLEGGAGMSAFCKYLGSASSPEARRKFSKLPKECASSSSSSSAHQFARCVLACMHAEAAPNQHLRVQNPNMDTEGQGSREVEVADDCETL